ncbi:hypothetical protein E4U25_007465 [Claviceps purpurea]|nr:hypothetical protein E4U25_007465 [Claviceps purpurea]
MADWCDLTVDELMQQRMEVDSESTSRNQNGDADAETSEPDSFARPTQPPSASRSAKPSSSRVTWDLRKTRVFLDSLVTEINDGALYRTSNKAVARSEMLQRVLPRMEEKFPATKWSLSSLTSKFKGLESDMKRALTLITRSGNHYDDETGIIETTEEQWEAFEKKHGDKAKAIRNKGIPWVESLMRQVWPDARPTGDGIDGARGWKRPREEAADETDTPDTAPPATPRVGTTPSTPGASTIPKRRHRRLDELQPQRAPAMSFETGLRLFSVSQSAPILRQVIEICVTDFGRELGAVGRQEVGKFFVEHPEFLAVFLAYPSDDRRLFLVSNDLIEATEEADDDRGGDDRAGDDDDLFM